MSAAEALRIALDLIDRNPELISTSPSLLARVIDIALKPPALGGSPGKITAQEESYDAVHKVHAEAAQNLGNVSTRGLPAVWRGAAGQTAVQAVQALVIESMKTAMSFEGAAAALKTWATELARAHTLDEHGRTSLQQARDYLISAGPHATAPVATLSPIKDLAASGCYDRLNASMVYDHAAANTVSALKQHTATARARLIKAADVDPLSAITLATNNPDRITPTALTRGSQRVNNMSAEDRSAFEKLLADSKSPEEAAYLWNAAASGYSLRDIQEFSAIIHPHGDDKAWLQQHLEPELNSSDALFTRRSQPDYNETTSLPWQSDGYDTPIYSQGPIGDCAPASTVVARATIDPVFMLGLSTGQGPAAVGGATAGDNSPAAFQKRLQYAYTSNNDTYLQTLSTSGLDPGLTQLDSHLLRPATGAEYDVRDVTDAATREAVLPKIEEAVLSGKPVPVDVFANEGDRPAHQLVIIGAKDDMLEVYNPWGYTQWVPKQQFVSGSFGAPTADDAAPVGGMPTPYIVQLPK